MYYQTPKNRLIEIPKNFKVVVGVIKQGDRYLEKNTFLVFMPKDFGKNASDYECVIRKC